ncbi:MAG: DNA-directed RNA polymerase subunit alpha [candidate division Zixibacteria bacterium CG_4_9_14_3_um_filter_46_8]|nr:MAG: DNA-directed RNA polymerase subunit alpha [candidate division Zixibacteria bacterium CG_4_9_14_3_um_filter_46_8]
MKWKSLQMPQEVNIDVDTASDYYTKFHIQPLERGNGLTLGHALRRTLLSSIPGAAVTAIRIDGVKHEFATIPGVLEDVTQIVLNVKQIRLKLHGDPPKKMVLDVSGPGDYTANDFELEAEIELLNPELHIVKLTEDVHFRMEMDVGSGRGYEPSESHKTLESPIGTIFVDSLFSPVTRVNYKVENARIGQRTDYDHLIIEIWTDGSIKPEESLTFAAKSIFDHLRIFIRPEDESEATKDVTEAPETVRVRGLLGMRVDELELSVRSSNCLRAANIITIADLVQRSESDMLKYRNFGRKSLTELNAILAEMKLAFGMDVSKYLEGTPESL